MLPASVRVRVTAEGQAIPGMFINARVRMKRKNDYDLPFGPTNGSGEITITREDLLREARKLSEFFLMDYSDIERENTGEIVITVFDAADVDRAITAHNDFANAGVQYPVNWEADLMNARNAFRDGVKDLHVDVSFEWST